MKATHSISLHLQIANPEQFNEVRSRLALQLKALGEDFPYASLTVCRLDHEEIEEVVNNDDVLEKVREVLSSVLLDDEVDSAIAAMQNAGILFSEREV